MRAHQLVGRHLQALRRRLEVEAQIGRVAARDLDHAGRRQRGRARLLHERGERRAQRLVADLRGVVVDEQRAKAGDSLDDAREALLRPGDFAIYDCSRPYTFVTNEPFRMLVSLLPRDIVGFSPERVRSVSVG